MSKYDNYSHFPDVWLSKIPAHWQVHKMKRLFAERSEKGYPNEPLLVASQNMGVVLKNVYGNRTVEAQKDLHLLKLVHIGDFVISLRSFQGGIEYAYYQGIISPAYTILVPYEPMSTPYFRYLAKSKPFIGLLTLCVTGIREGQNIDYTKLKNHPLPLPPHEEQDQIVRFLDWKVSSINRLINQHKSRIQVLTNLKSKLIDDVTIQGLDNVSLRQNDDIRWNITYPMHWKLLRLRELFSFRKGLSITKANLEDSGIPVISYGQVHSKKNFGIGINDELIRFVNASYLETDTNALVEQGDFIFADTSEDVAGCGNCVYVDRDETIFAGYHTVIAHPKSVESSRYLSYLFQAPTWRYQIHKKVSAVKVYSITQKILKDVFVLLPPYDEQKRIVEYLDEICSPIEASIAKIECEIQQLHNLKSTLISDVVTGKIDVRGIEIPEYEFVDEDTESGEDAEDFEESEEE